MWKLKAVSFLKVVERIGISADKLANICKQSSWIVRLTKEVTPRDLSMGDQLMAANEPMIRRFFGSPSVSWINSHNWNMLCKELEDLRCGGRK